MERLLTACPKFVLVNTISEQRLRLGPSIEKQKTTIKEMKNNKLHNDKLAYYGINLNLPVLIFY